MLQRALLFNVLALMTGLIFGIGFVGAHQERTYAQTRGDQTQAQGIDIYNNDYQFPNAQAEQFKDNKIFTFQSQSMDIQAFESIDKDDDKAKSKENVAVMDLDEELDQYYIELERQDIVKKKAQKEFEKNRYLRYQEYLKVRTKLSRDVEKEMAHKLDPFVVSAKDAKLMSLDED